MTTTGIGLAFESDRARAAAPVRSATIGAIIGVAGVAGVMVYAASFDHLVATPAYYGYSMTGIVRSPESAQLEPGHCRLDNTTFASNPHLSAAALVCSDSFEVDGRSVPVWGFRSLKGAIEPTIVRGRNASAPTEITLGGVTLDAIDKDIGDHVRVTTDAGPLDYEIVGQQVLPSPVAIDPLPIADNAGMTAEGFERALKDAQHEVNFDSYATLADGDSIDALPRVQMPFDSTGVYVNIGHNTGLQLPTVPDELTRVRQVDDLPVLLGLFLALLGIATVTHALFTSVRRRGHDLAVLRALGFRRRQVRLTIAWEAASLITIGLLVGIPLGVLIGRTAWTAVADNLGVVATVAVPLAALTALTLVTLFVVVLIGLISSRHATRPSPAAALAVE